MQISGNTYRVWRDSGTDRVNFEGSLRLSGGAAYAPIAQLLQETADRRPKTIIIDLSRLQYLNSAGLNMMYKFALRLRKQGSSKLIVYGAEAIPWQKKMLSQLGLFINNLDIKYI